VRWWWWRGLCWITRGLCKPHVNRGRHRARARQALQLCTEPTQAWMEARADQGPHRALTGQLADGGQPAVAVSVLPAPGEAKRGGVVAQRAQLPGPARLPSGPVRPGPLDRHGRRAVQPAEGGPAGGVGGGVGGQQPDPVGLVAGGDEGPRPHKVRLHVLLLHKAGEGHEVAAAGVAGRLGVAKGGRRGVEQVGAVGAAGVVVEGGGGCMGGEAGERRASGPSAAPCAAAAGGRGVRVWARRLLGQLRAAGRLRAALHSAEMLLSWQGTSDQPQAPL
jgi:hypothetical protein